MAVKCLSILLRRVNQNQIIDISKKLALLVLDGNPALRDIYSICMKTLIADVKESMGKSVSDHLVNSLIAGIDRPEEDVKKECLDNISDLLKRFGHELNDGHFNRIMTGTIQQLKHGRPNIRKRASNTLGALAFVLSDESLNELMKVLLARIGELERGSKSSKTSAEASTLISTIGVISRTVGYKLGKYLSQIVPLFIRFCGDPDDEDLQTDQGNELRESCFPGLESFVYRCPKEITTYLSDILSIALQYAKYDPNYNYGDEDGDEVMETDEDYGDDDYGDDMGSDEDDSSWKVRKASLKVISAIITAHPSLVRDLYDRCADELLGRFKEREENVRLDIISCYTKLVDLNLPVTTQDDSETDLGSPKLVRQKSTSDLLADKVDAIVRVSCVQLQGNSAPSKVAVIKLLQSLVHALQGGLNEFLPASSKLSGLIEKLLHDKNQTLKLETLHFLRACYMYHSPSVLIDNISRFLPLIGEAVNDEWYKIIAEALRVLQTMITTIRPIDPETQTLENNPNFDRFIPDLHACIFARLETLDIDLEIKECGISCIGTLYKHCGDRLTDSLPALLALLQKRLENETTRTATLKTLSAIASSPLQLDLSAFTVSSGDVLSSFLKQYSRNLKQLTLQTLTALVSNRSTQLTSSFVQAIVTESANLINESDLHLANLSVQLVLALLKKDAAAAVPPVCDVSAARLLRFTKSSMTQGPAVQSLVEVYRYMVFISTTYPTLGFPELFSSLYDPTKFLPTGETTLSKQSLTNISKCIAAITTMLPSEGLQSGVQKFAKDAVGSDDTVAQLALLSMGEVGQQADLAMLPDLKDVILQCFERSNEDVKLAAAYALGHIAVGSMDTFLPLLLQAIASPTHARQQYLLLTALRETIVTFAVVGKDFGPYLDHALPILLAQKDAEEESVRNMVAECLGVLTSMTPERLLAVLQEQLLSLTEQKRVLKVAAHAMRVALSRSVDGFVLGLLRNVMPTFLRLLSEEDLDVKKAVILLVNTAAHHNVGAIASFIPSAIFPILLQTLQIKLERVIDLGPFKHKIDDNLVLRKLSLMSLEILMQAAPDKFDCNAVLDISTVLLADHADVKMLFIQLLPRLAKHTPSAVAIKIDDIVPALEKILADSTSADNSASSSTAGGAASTIQTDKLAGQRAVLRTLIQLDKVEDVRNISRRWVEFVTKVRGAPTLAESLRQLESEAGDNY